MSMSKAQRSNKNTLRDSYFAGEISVDQYVDQILRGREGDRRRQNIEKKYVDITKKMILQK